MSADQPPLWRRTSSEVLAVVVDAELAELMGYRVGKAQALEALAARRELTGRMLRHRWLAMETARAAGASWAEIDTSLGLGVGEARLEYEATWRGRSRWASWPQIGPIPVSRSCRAMAERPSLLLDCRARAAVAVGGRQGSEWRAPRLDLTVGPRLARPSVVHLALPASAIASTANTHVTTSTITTPSTTPPPHPPTRNPKLPDTSAPGGAAGSSPIEVSAR